jgi:undecaprenyl-diphosphatase
MLEAIFFGIIQGLTEFLPISSSAHVRIFGEFSGMSEDPGAKFTAIMQIGTEIAVLIFFRKDIARIISAWFRKVIFRKDLHIEEATDARIGWLIIIGSLPIAVLGYLGQEAITTKFRSLWLIATVLIIFGIILGIADRYGKSEKNLNDLNNSHGILYGLAQVRQLQWEECLDIAEKQRLDIHFYLRFQPFLAAGSMNLSKRSRRSKVQMSSH